MLAGLVQFTDPFTKVSVWVVPSAVILIQRPDRGALTEFGGEAITRLWFGPNTKIDVLGRPEDVVDILEGRTPDGDDQGPSDGGPRRG